MTDKQYQITNYQISITKIQLTKNEDKKNRSSNAVIRKCIYSL